MRLPWSPRTLHELGKLHADRPDQVHALLASEAEITRASAMPSAPPLLAAAWALPISCAGPSR